MNHHYNGKQVSCIDCIGPLSCAIMNTTLFNKTCVTYTDSGNGIMADHGFTVEDFDVDLNIPPVLSP